MHHSGLLPSSSPDGFTGPIFGLRWLVRSGVRLKVIFLGRGWQSFFIVDFVLFDIVRTRLFRVIVLVWRVVVVVHQVVITARGDVSTRVIGLRCVSKNIVRINA